MSGPRGEHHFVDAVGALDPLLRELHEASEVAVDTEFHAEGRYFPDPMLLQLCVRGGRPWLVDPRVPAVVDALAPALRAVPTWILHGGDRDLVLLQRLLGGIAPLVLDTQILAGFVGRAYPAGLATLLESWLGVDVDKSATLSDWARRPLDEEQLTYAAEDVRHLLSLADLLRAAVAQAGRTGAAEEACRDAMATATAEQPPEDLWRDISTQARTPDEAARVQALLRWRDEEARRLDKPPGYLLSDTLLRRLARNVPDNLDHLAADRRVHDRFVRRHGRALLEILHGDLPEPMPSVCPPHSEAARLQSWMEIVAAAIAAQEGLAADLLLPSRLAHRLAADASRGDAPRATGWRGALIDQTLAQALRGAIHVYWNRGDIRSEVHSCPIPHPPVDA